MPMAAELGERYRALFVTYGTGGNFQLMQLKNRIAEQAGSLRPDAMYFLLVGLDHMVVRALAGYVPQLEHERVGQPMVPFVSPGEAEDMANRALDVLLEEMSRQRSAGAGQLSSANDVARAIASSSKTIGSFVAWWRNDA